jgi:hypothetical protein
MRQNQLDMYQELLDIEKEQVINLRKKTNSYPSVEEVFSSFKIEWLKWIWLGKSLVYLLTNLTFNSSSEKPRISLQKRSKALRLGVGFT